MCTSFVVFGERTFIGMNFDISDRPIRLSLKGQELFLIEQQEGANWYPAFGLRRNGTFMNLLTVEPVEQGEYRRGRDCVHIMKVFDDLLSGRSSVTALDGLLREKQIVNVPGLSVHSMVTGPDGYARVIEPGRQNIALDSSGNSFMALTNFPLSDFAGQPWSRTAGDGADRYQLCCRMLANHDPGFSVEQGLAILEATAQHEGAFPTQFSMVAVPEDEQVHFTIRRKFKDRYIFSFVEGCIRAAEGIAYERKIMLDRKGLLLSRLEQV